jgi:hypothetical protein
MAIPFHDATHLGLAVFILVLQEDLPLGRIFHKTGGYRFYTGEEPTLGVVDLADKQRIDDGFRVSFHDDKGGFTGSLTKRALCIPGTVDPREPKGK